MPTRSASTRRRWRPRLAGRATTCGGPARAPGGHGVEEGVVHDLDARRRAAPAASRRRSGGCAGRSRAARRGRGRRRTSTRRPRAAPGRCRCWTSPCRGGCAARGSAARAGRPGGPRRRPTRRRAGRAGAARGPRRPPCSRRAGRRRRAARRSAGRSRPRRRRRARRAPRAAVSASRSAATTASAPRSWAASITARGSRTRPEAPGYCTSTPDSVALGQAVGEVGDDHVDAHRLGAGADHVDRLRERVGVDHERAGRPCGCRDVRASSPPRRRCPRRAARRWRWAAR